MRGKELWGFTRYSLTGAVGPLGGLTGGAGFILLAVSLIARIPAAWLRYGTGFLVVLACLVPGAIVALNTLGFLVAVASMTDTFREVAPDGQTVVVRGGGFDPYAITLHTEHDQYHYQRQQTTRFEHPEHVNAEDCHLETADDHLILTCAPETVSINPAPKAKAN